MGTTSKAVQPTVWLLDNTLPDLLPDALRYVRVLKLPAPILQSISRLDPVIDRLPPVGSLNDTLAAFSREIIAFEPFSEQRVGQRWLYARRNSNLNPDRVKTLIKGWLIACYGDEHAKAIFDGWRGLDWVWDDIDLQTADLKTKQMLLPGLITRWLLDQGFSLTLEDNGGEVVLPLRLVPIMTQRYRAELISEPQVSGKDLYSFVLRFWVEPMPGALCLHHRLSIRRWISAPLVNNGWVNLKWMRGKSVYLRCTVGYLDAPQDEESQVYDDVFSRITLKYLGGGIDGLRWVGNQAKVFEHLRLDNAPPPTQDLARNPLAYRDRVLITVEARDGKSQKVKTGLQVADHKHVFYDLDQQFGTWVPAMPLWKRVEIGDALGERSLSQEQKKIENTERLAALQAMPGPVRIEVHAHDALTFKAALLHEVGAFSDYKHQLGDKSICIIDGSKLLMEIAEGQDPKLTDLLSQSAAQNKDMKRHAIQARQSEIAKRYPYADTPTGALIALHPYHESFVRDMRERDPKTAIRYGLADAGRVSQFVMPKGTRKESADAYPHRVTNAARDLLRVLGYRYNPFYTRLGGLPEQVDLVAFWLIQLNARSRTEQTVILPIVVDTPFGTQHLRMFVPRDTGSAELYPTLREGILAAVAFDADFSEKEVTAFFRDAIEQRRSQNPTLLLVCDQNLRRAFPELDEQSTVTSAVSLNNILTEDMDHVRVGRLRFSSDGEAPFCIPDAEMGKYQGLYSHRAFPNVFMSLHNIGDRQASPNWNKLDWLTKASVNPSTVQIRLNNLQPNDDPAEWAALIHRLRCESSHTDIATVLPQPIHDMQAVTDYLSRLVVADDDEDLNSLSTPGQE